MIFLKTIGDTVPNPYQSAMTEIERREFLRESLKSTGVALAGVGVLTGTSCNRQSEIRNPTRAELIKRLEKLAESKPLDPSMGGASCYMRIYPPREKKSCPACERTMTIGEKDEILREYNVPLKRIQDQKIDAKLIVPEHCATCGFGLKEAKFQLEITYPDHPDPVRIELDSAFDLELMVLFLHGKERYKEVYKFGGEHEGPLKYKVDRLRELFGVKEEQ